MCEALRGLFARRAEAETSFCSTEAISHSTDQTLPLSSHPLCDIASEASPSGDSKHVPETPTAACDRES